MTNPTDSNGSERLDAVIAEYLQQVEGGTAPDRDALLAAHPELADQLRAYFADLDALRDRGESFRLPELALPEDFGDYEFLAEVGRGGMGVVYRARQKSRDRVVALKMILSGPLADAPALRRFREEAETVSQLDHPNIVPVYEVGEHRGRPYFTMKLIEGQSLTKCLDRYTEAPPAAEMLVKVCDAIHHAHRRGVLHRDLKPGNILIDAAGEPHVTDFGLARRLEEARSLTSTGAILGTPEYMAPEQAAGGHAPTVAVDVYGLGAILYAVLTGRPPFEAGTVYDTLRRVVEDAPVAPRDLRPLAPPDLEAVCLKCLEKNPERRYATAEAVEAELRRFRAGQPVRVRPPGRWGRLSRWARRKPTLAALYATACAAAVLVASVGVVSGLWQFAEAAKGRTEAARLEAEGERDERERARQAEETARIAAEAAGERVAVFEYGRTVQLAHQAWRDGELATAQARLSGTPEKLRGWEWHYTRRLANSGPIATMPKYHFAAPHRWNTRSAHWSPDGRRFALALDGGVHVFDATGRQTAALDGKTYVTPDQGEIAFSPDGKRLLTSGTRLWDAETGKLVAELAAAEAPVWSRDGSRLLGLGRLPGPAKGTPGSLVAKRWDARTGAEILTHDATLVRPVSSQLAWDPDGRKLAVAVTTPKDGRPWGGIHIIDADTGARVREFLCGPGTVGAKWSPDGSRLVTASLVHQWTTGVHGEAVTFGLWDAATGARLPFSYSFLRGELEYDLHINTVTNAVQFSEDGVRLLVRHGSRGRLRAWDAATGKEGSVAPDAAWLSYSPRGDLVAVGFPDGSARVLDARTGAEVAALKDCDVSDTGDRHLLTMLNSKRAAWSADGALLAYRTSGSKLGVWNARTGERVATPDGFSDGSHFNGGWSPVERKIALLHPDKTARVWDVRSGQSVVLKGQAGQISCAAWSPDGKRVLTHSEGDERTTHVWDAQTGAELASRRTHRWDQAVLPFWSPDGRWIVTGAPNSDARDGQKPRFEVWDAVTLKPAHALSVAENVTPQPPVWSPDGKRLLLRSHAGGVNVLDAGTWKESAVLKAQSGQFIRAVWSPDGTRVLTANGVDVWVWNPDTGAVVSRLAVPFGELAPRDGFGQPGGTAWSPDGKRIVTACYELVDSRPAIVAWNGGAILPGRVSMGLVRVWDAETGALLHALGGAGSLPRAGEVGFTPDGTRTLAAGLDFPIPVFDARTGARLAELTGHRDWITGAAFSPDGGRVATSSRDRTARVWDAITGAQVAVLDGHASTVDAAFWSRDGKRIVTSSADRTTRLWDARTGKEQASRWWRGGRTGSPPHPLPGTLSPDGTRMLATTEGGDGIELWDTRPARVELTSTGHAGTLGATVETLPVYGGNNRFVFRGPALAWNTDGTRIVTAGADGTVRMWDPGAGRELSVVWRDRGQITAMTFSPDGMRFVTTSSDGTARVWDARSGRQVGTLEGHTGALTAAAFSPDGSKIVTASVDGTARIWETPAGDLLPRRAVAVLENSASPQLVNEVTAVAWSPDGTRLVTGSRGVPGRVWDTRTWKPVAALPVADVTGVAWSPRGDRVLLRARSDTSNAQYGGRAYLWNPATGKALASGETGAVAWSGDGRKYLLTTWKVMVHDAEGGAELADLNDLPLNELGFPNVYPEPIPWAAFNPAGTHLLTACSEGTGVGSGVRIWKIDAKETKPEVVLKTGQLCGAAWSPDGTRVATGHADGTLRVWDAASGKVLATAPGAQTTVVTAAAWHPSGAWVLTAEPPVRNPDSATETLGRSCVWDARTGHLVRAYPAGDGNRSWPDGTAILFTPPGRAARNEVLARTADGRYELFVGKNPEQSTPPAPVRDAEIRDAGTKTVAVLKGHVGEVFVASFSPDGSRVVTWGRDGTVRVWHAATGAELLVLKGDADGLPGSNSPVVSWSPDGHRILVAGLGRGVTILDATPLGR